MAQRIGDLVQDVVASPLGDVIASVGAGVAAAQQALDDASLAKTLEIYAENGDAAHALLREIGYRPTFYALPETTGEVRVSLSLASQPGASTGTAVRPTPTATSVQLSRLGRTLGVAPKLYATPVDASYANRYGYQANISAKLTFKIVPVPAPQGVDELRIAPSLKGQTVAQAIATLNRLDLQARFLGADASVVETPTDNAVIASQSPDPDTILRQGDSLSLTLAP